MNPLLKLSLILGGLFASTFIVAKSTGFLSLEQIQAWLVTAKHSSPAFVGPIITLLLAADLFVTVPTLSLSILAGYFLGFPLGAAYALAGVMIAGSLGYFLSRLFGEKIVVFLIKEPEKREELIQSFERYGFTMILISRAVPMLPEITACLSGMTKMPFWKFATAWVISSVPYIVAASYSGSISSLNDPKPAIITAIGITAILWLSWFFLHRKKKLAVVGKKGPHPP